MIEIYLKFRLVEFFKKSVSYYEFGKSLKINLHIFIPKRFCYDSFFLII
jgi:hypothetical protein